MEITPAITGEFLVFEDSARLSEMFGKLKQYEKQAGLVFRNKKYLGLVEKKKLLRSNVNPDDAKIKNFIQATPTLGDHASVIEAADMLFKSNSDLLPVEQDKRIIGVVQSLDVANLGMGLDELQKYKVQDVKFSKPKIIQKDDPVSVAISVMYTQKTDHVPVFDKGKLYGILSYRDLMRKYLNWSPKRDNSAKFNKNIPTKSARVDSSSFGSLPVHNFSTNSNLLTIQPSQKLKVAVSKMVKHKVSDLLVMQGNELQGILTMRNILKVIGALKIPRVDNIKFVGLSKLRITKPQVEAVKKIASNEAFKIQRLLKQEFELSVHIKDYSKEGKQQKYSVHLHVTSPKVNLTVQQEDWDLRTALRKTFENVKNTLSKKFRRK